jgi:hypothetical protein
VEECERRFRRTKLRISTTNIGLARLPEGLELVRVGPALRPEFAAWRYGDQFGRRRRRAAYAIGAGLAAVVTVTAGGVNAGLAAGSAAAAVINAAGAMRLLYRRQRTVCRVPREAGEPSPVREEHLRDARVLIGGAWGHTWGLYDSHAAGESVLTGMDAVQYSGRLLARINRFGASGEDVGQAVRILDRHGDARNLFRWAAKQPEFERHRLCKLPIEYRLALEMAAHEETERDALAGELAKLEEAWREAEEIAAIADELLLPPSVSEFLERQHSS